MQNDDIATRIEAFDDANGGGVSMPGEFSPEAPE